MSDIPEHSGVATDIAADEMFRIEFEDEGRNHVKEILIANISLR